MKASKLMAAALSLFVAAACGAVGGGPTTAPSRATADPCTLLTQADIRTATGSDYGVGVPDSYGHCRWFFGTSTVDEGNGMVTVFFASAGTTLASVKSGAAGGDDATVSGHPAYWDAVPFGPSMWVDLGTSVLAVGIDPLPVGGKAMAQRLAELAVAKV